MSVVDRERWRQLEPLLDHALELTAREQAEWLEQLRTTAPGLAEELGALLAGEPAADRDGFLAAPLEVTLTGLELGAYTLERPIGQGGMGTVWLARRTDGRFEGQAAIKLLNLSLLSAAGQARFRQEGSVLARLAHAGIARLLDAGVGPGGQPYLVLEYVEGERIDAFADGARLPLDARLRLVLQVLAAVGHAHANLVVHRDLKPSNILITADGTAKLLDFGIAKLLAADADADVEGAALTVDGGRALTPEFAAPEQMRGGAITTVTDVYAAGVLLYVLLTGRRPYELAGRTAADVERLVCEVEPPRPSAAFEDGAREGDDAAEHARARAGTPDRLRRQLRGDLDAIVLQALHKEPARRYSSVAALAADLERYLDGRPVVARPDGAAYRVRRFVARHRGPVSAVAAAVALLAGAAFRERALRGRAEAEADKSRAVEDYLVSVFDVADPFSAPGRAGSEVTARALLDRGAARIDSVLGDQPEVQAELRGVLGHVYTNLGLYAQAAPLLERALAQRRAVHGARHAEVAEAMDELGELLMLQNEFDRAEPLLRDALELRRELLGNASAETALSLDHLATLYQERNDYAAAEPLFREAVAVRRAALGPQHEMVAASLNNLGLLYFLKGEYDRAEPLYRDAIAIYRRALGDDHPQTASSVQNLAQLQQVRGHFEEADTLYRRALAAKRKVLGNAHPSVTVNLNNLGGMLARELGQLDEAEALIREALALDRRIFGERHAYVAESLNNLGTVLRLKGDFDGAERLFREALAMNRSLFGEEHTHIAGNLNNLGSTRRLRGDVAGAIPIFRESLAQYGRLVGVRHRYYVLVSINLAGALREQGNSAAAESLFRAAAARLDTTNLAQRGQFIAAQVGLGRALTDRGRAAEALPVLERALAMSRTQYRAGDWRSAEPRLALGACLASLGEHARAEPLLREARALLEQQRRAQPRLAAEADAALSALPGRVAAATPPRRAAAGSR